MQLTKNNMQRIIATMCNTHPFSMCLHYTMSGTVAPRTHTITLLLGSTVVLGLLSLSKSP